MNSVISLYGKAFFYTPGVVIAFLGFYSLVTVGSLDFNLASMWLTLNVAKLQESNFDLVTAYMSISFVMGTLMVIVHFGTMLTESFTFKRPFKGYIRGKTLEVDNVH
jgi:hypothetical protein